MAANLLLVCQGVEPAFALAQGFKEPSFALKALLCTVADATRQSGFFLSSISSHDCQIAYKVVADSANDDNDVMLVLASTDITLSEGMLQWRMERIDDMLGFMLGPTWNRVQLKLLRAAIGGLKPIIERYLFADANSVEFCLGYPRMCPSEFKFPDTKAIAKALLKESDTNFLRIGAVFYKNALCATTGLWESLISHRDSFCIATHLALFNADTQKELHCFLDPPEDSFTEKKELAFLEDRKRAKRLLCFQIVPDVRLVFICSPEDVTLQQAAQTLLRKDIMTKGGIQRLRSLRDENYKFLAKILGLNANILDFLYISMEKKRIIQYTSRTSSSMPSGQTFKKFRGFVNCAVQEFFDPTQSKTKTLCLDYYMKMGEYIFYGSATKKGFLFVAMPDYVPLGTEGKITRYLHEKIESCIDTYITPPAKPS
eukprot:jgi/Bigna1/69534/fgenesh1_pg.9_\